MKIKIIALIVPFLFTSMRPPENEKDAEIWYKNLSESLDKYIKETPSDQRTRDIGECLYKLGDKMPNNDKRWVDLYGRSQRALMNVPGHARFFSDEFLRLYREGMEEQEANKDKGNHVSAKWYDAKSAYLYQFRTLMYLPSPETITVLGEILKETWQPPDRLSLPTTLALNSLPNYSIVVLEELKLRDAPERGPIPYQDALTRQKNNLAYLNQWRAWWAEVKSGKRAFSFKGQAVEYRFKPDGTWDTIPIANPPDDGPKPIPARQPLPSPAPASAVPAPQQKPIWVWLGAALGTAFIGIMAYLKRKKKV